MVTVIFKSHRVQITQYAEGNNVPVSLSLNPTGFRLHDRIRGTIAIIVKKFLMIWFRLHDRIRGTLETIINL